LKRFVRAQFLVQPGHPQSSQAAEKLLWFIWFIWFLWSVWLVWFNQMNKTDQTNQTDRQDRPNRPNEQDRLADFFSILLEKRNALGDHFAVPAWGAEETHLAHCDTIRDSLLTRRRRT
jgi:hypothetical protein